MKKVYQNNFILRICLVLCFMMGFITSGFEVDAASTESVTARIPFSYEDKSGVCENATIIIEYEAGMLIPDANTKTVTSGGSDYFSIDADKVGIYKYKIYQKTGDNSSVKYDDTVYDVTVYVTNMEGTNKLEYTITAVSNDSGAKPDKLEFVNSGIGDPGKKDKDSETESKTSDSTEKTPETLVKTKTETATSTKTKTADEVALYTVIIICLVAFIFIIGIVRIKKHTNGE